MIRKGICYTSIRFRIVLPEIWMTPADLRTLQFNRNDKRFSDLINGGSDEGSEISWRTYTLIRDVSFDYDEDIPDIVKCTVVYTADGKTGEYVFALVKKSGQPSP